MIKSLNLDKTFIPTNFYSINYEMLQFSGGEMHIKLDNSILIDECKIESCEKVIITHRLRNGDDIMKVLIAQDALKRKGVKHFELVIPYVPYARQDRQCTEGESFTLDVFAKIINSAKFDKVITLDNHSDVSTALIKNCKNIPNDDCVMMAVDNILSNPDQHSHPITLKELILVSPDSGANKKSNKLFDNLKCFKSLVKCDKRRNTTDGSLSGFEVFSNDLNGLDCLICDDLIDGGRTFIGIAQELKKKNAGNIYLFVTHGIFSYGFDELAKYFKKIYTTNSFKDIDHPLVEQFKISLYE